MVLVVSILVNLILLVVLIVITRAQSNEIVIGNEHEGRAFTPTVKVHMGNIRVVKKINVITVARLNGIDTITTEFSMKVTGASGSLY
jgi:hypothetical protein